MKFYLYFMAILIDSYMAAASKSVHGYDFVFWLFIGFAGFLWLCAYGELRVKNTTNPF